MKAVVSNEFDSEDTEPLRKPCITSRPQLLGLLLPGEQRTPRSMLRMETFIFLLNPRFVCANRHLQGQVHVEL